MSRVSLQNLQNLDNPTTAVSTINNNNTIIQNKLDELLSRTGEIPNEMNASLDMNGNPILNLPAPVNPTDVLRLVDMPDLDELEQALADALVEIDAAEADAIADVEAAGTSIVSDAEAARDAALAAQTAAELAETHAETAETNAETAETNAETAEANAEAAQAAAELAETNAETAADLAGRWATEAEDVVVTGGEYSAYHWAQKAADFASSGSVDWGSINGTLSDQTDLQNALDAKLTTSALGTTINGLTGKATPVDADELVLADSAATSAPKKVTFTQAWTNYFKSKADALYQAVASALTSWASVTRASGFDTFVATPSSANLRSLLTDEVGTGNAYFTGGALGTPASGTLTNATGLPLSGISGDSVTALAVGSIELGHASNTTISRPGAGDIAIEGNVVYRAGGTDVPITDGGTGVSTLTANNVLLGNGTSAIQFVAPGTSGNVLTSNGTTWASSAAPSGGIANYQTSQPTSDTNAVGFTGLSGCRVVEFAFAWGMIASNGSTSLTLQGRVSGGTWRSFATLLSPADTVKSRHYVRGTITGFNANQDMKNVFVTEVRQTNSTHDASDATNILTVDTNAANGRLNGSAPSWNEVWDEIQLITGSGNRISGGTADERGWFTVWGFA